MYGRVLLLCAFVTPASADVCGELREALVVLKATAAFYDAAGTMRALEAGTLSGSDNPAYASVDDAYRAAQEAAEKAADEVSRNAELTEQAASAIKAAVGVLAAIKESYPKLIALSGVAARSASEAHSVARREYYELVLGTACR